MFPDFRRNQERLSEDHGQGISQEPVINDETEQEAPAYLTDQKDILE